MLRLTSRRRAGPRSADFDHRQPSTPERLDPAAQVTVSAAADESSESDTGRPRVASAFAASSWRTDARVRARSPSPDQLDRRGGVHSARLL